MNKKKLIEKMVKTIEKMGFKSQDIWSGVFYLDGLYLVHDISDKRMLLDNDELTNFDKISKQRWEHGDRELNQYLTEIENKELDTKNIEISTVKKVKKEKYKEKFNDEYNNFYKE